MCNVFGSKVTVDAMKFMRLMLVVLCLWAGVGCAGPLSNTGTEGPSLGVGLALCANPVAQGQESGCRAFDSAMLARAVNNGGARGGALGVGFGANGGAPNIVYRALTSADAASIEAGTGLAAKAPNGTWTAAEHVANAGPGTGGAAANSPWISTTRVLDVAKGYEGGNGIVGIDLSKVGSFQTEVWQTAPRVNGVEGLPYFRSIWAQEVTVFQEIPQSAIIKLPVPK